MTTLMQCGNSEGIQGRCDAKCHEATDPDCICMCGGAFHGRARTSGGLEAAVDEYWEDVREKAQVRASEQGFSITFGRDQAVLPIEGLR